MQQCHLKWPISADNKRRCIFATNTIATGGAAFWYQSPLYRERSMCTIQPLLLCQLPDPHRTLYVCLYYQIAWTMRPALWYYTWPLHRNLATGFSRILATVSYLVWRFMHKFNFPMLVNIKLCSFYTIVYMGRNPHSLAELPVAHPVSILSPQAWKTDSYFLVATYPLCRSQWPRGLRRRSSAARLLRLWVRIPPGAWMFVCLSVVSVMCCQAEVSATGWSLAQRDSADCGASKKQWVSKPK